MYWRVKKISPEQLAKAYGVYVVCAFSVIFNLFMMAKMAPAKGLTEGQKADFDNFVRNVTRHLVDGSYVSYESSMASLAFNEDKSELAPAVIRLLAQDETIPPSIEAMKAIARQLRDTKSVTAINFTDVKMDEPDSKGLMPVTVSAMVVKHSAEGALGPNPIRFRYLVGMRGGAPGVPGWPVIAAFQDASGQAE